MKHPPKHSIYAMPDCRSRQTPLEKKHPRKTVSRQSGLAGPDRSLSGVIEQLLDASLLPSHSQSHRHQPPSHVAHTFRKCFPPCCSGCPADHHAVKGLLQILRGDLGAHMSRPASWGGGEAPWSLHGCMGPIRFETQTKRMGLEELRPPGWVA